MRKAAILILIALSAGSVSSQQPTDTNVTRATLDNGLRVVIVRDPLAPVATIYDNYLAGADETPAGFPGMAHAQEHMAFRGCAGVTADQIAAIYARLGGYGNADTQQTVTQYFTTVPASDLDTALRLDAACMQNVEDAQSEWDTEKGAIEQEVSRDLSDPIYKFLTRLNEDMFAGSPYAHDALGTRESFDKTTGQMLMMFYRSWYAPNNAVLVIAGDVDPQATMAAVRKWYGPIGRRPIDAHPVVTLQPVKSESFSLDSNLPYLLALISYRLPGTDSADFAATRILADVLSSQRADLYALVPEGKALGAEFDLEETYPKASVGFALTAVPSGTDPDGILATVRGIVARYVADGIPGELVDAAKHMEIAQAEFRRNSIPDLANTWSNALAVEGRNSPDEDVDAIRRVTADDVTRVARRYLVAENSITATLVPKASGEGASSKGFGGGEQTTSAPTGKVTLPDWAEKSLASLKAPDLKAPSRDVRLANGIRLIVQTERTSPTVTVVGSVKHEAHLETPPGKDGTAEILTQLFSFGTTHLGRLAFQKALDDIAASETAGYDFSLHVLKGDLSRGVELLADNVLNPALPAEGFSVVQKELSDFVAGQLTTPAYRSQRAELKGLLPPGDPALRETTPDTVAKISLDDVKAFHAHTFRPDLTTITVIGDVEPAAARAVIERFFGEWTATGAKPDVVLPRVPPNPPSAFTVPDADAVQTSVTLEEELPITRFDDDYYALQLGNHVLGGGFYATRLYHDLRQVTGYVYNVDDSLGAGESRSLYSVTYGCDAGNVGKARDLIERDLRAMQTENVTPQELEQARAILVRQLPLRESSEDAVADGLVARAQIGLPLDEPARGAARYLALTADQVRAAFARWVRPDGFVEVARGPAPR